MLTQQEIEETFAQLGLATEEDRARFRRMRQLHLQPTGRKDTDLPHGNSFIPLTIEQDDAEVGGDSQRT
jgi:hypothetical protein